MHTSYMPYWIRRGTSDLVEVSWQHSLATYRSSTWGYLLTLKCSILSYSLSVEVVNSSILLLRHSDRSRGLRDHPRPTAFQALGMTLRASATQQADSRTIPLSYHLPVPSTEQETWVYDQVDPLLTNCMLSVHLLLAVGHLLNSCFLFVWPSILLGERRSSSFSNLLQLDQSTWVDFRSDIS